MNEYFTSDYTFVGEEKTYLPTLYLKHEKEIKDFEVRDSDVFVVSYPKAGTTWTQEMVWLIANDLNFEGAKVSLNRRFPYFEVSTSINIDNLKNVPKEQLVWFSGNSLEIVKNLKSPRFIKSHLPFSLLPDDICKNRKAVKVIYVMRNPKDICVSYYHHAVLLDNTKISLEEFCKLFLKDKLMYSPFWKHVLGFWRQKHMPNLLIVTYEDMKKDLPSVIRKVSEFLNKNPTDEQVKQLCTHLSFDSMKQNPTLNREEFVGFLKRNNFTEGKGQFMRAGIVGKYKEEMSPDLIKKFEDWIRQNVGGTGFSEEYPGMVA